MTHHSTTPDFATLADGRTRIDLGWRPRDARQRLAASEHYADDAWIKVHGRIRCPDDEWSFIDPCLTEHEAMALITFLEHRPWIAGQSCRFLEPCLSLHSDRAPDGAPSIRWCFRGEAAPPRIDPDDRWDAGFEVTITTDDQSLHRFAASLRSLLNIP